MDQNQYQAELFSFAEKISLAKLEEAKAAQRVRELEFERDRFQKDIFLASLKPQQPEAQ